MNEVIVGDCRTIMRSFPTMSYDLVFADPPFGIGYEYDMHDDRMSTAEYHNFTLHWLSSVRRILKPTGSLFVAIGDDYVAHTKTLIDTLGLTLRNWIIWHYTFGVNCRRKFARSHTHILYYSVDPKKFTFNAGAVKIPSARQAKYNDKRAASGGKIPDDVWTEFPRVCGTFKERGKHPCQMPQALLERIVRVASNPGDIVLDPFAGSGTTLAAAKKLGRNYCGIELSAAYAAEIEKRLASVNCEI
jgi:site-specific DNA-methyltransferase (adenine-specific)